ncbi:MAG: 3-dehydroquinate synthase [Clostridia bacterium]
MEKINMNFSKKFEMLIGEGILKEIGPLVFNALKSISRVFIITDETVSALYLSCVADSLKSSGFFVDSFVLKPGENSKSFSSVTKIYSKLVSCGFSRNDCIISLGGGVIGDIAGFVASTYNRGMKLIHIPTTLLAMADSAIGGKAAVNIEEGKNLVGAFIHPELIVADTLVLRSLKKTEISCGIAEVIKTAAIDDISFFNSLFSSLPLNYTSIIKSCAIIKSHFVAADEFDSGERRKLNFGHTFGHAFETALDYRAKHGQCVALGMLYSAKLGEMFGITKAGTFKKLSECLTYFSLPSIEFSPSERERAFSLLAIDKKHSNSKIDMIFLSEIGSSFRMKIEVSTLVNSALKLNISEFILPKAL